MWLFPSKSWKKQQDFFPHNSHHKSHAQNEQEQYPVWNSKNSWWRTASTSPYSFLSLNCSCRYKWNFKMPAWLSEGSLLFIGHPFRKEVGTSLRSSKASKSEENKKRMGHSLGSGLKSIKCLWTKIRTMLPLQILSWSSWMEQTKKRREAIGRLKWEMGNSKALASTELEAWATGQPKVATQINAQDCNTSGNCSSSRKIFENTKCWGLITPQKNSCHRCLGQEGKKGRLVYQ